MESLESAECHGEQNGSGRDRQFKEADGIMTGTLLRTTADETLEQGREEGRKLGENAARSLFDFLLRHGRSEDAARAASDRKFFVN